MTEQQTEVELPQVEAPASTQEQVEQEQRESKQTEIKFRKYDSDDVIRIRSKSIVVDLEEKRVDSGMLQKVSICVGIKSCPWFSHDISENDGVTDEIFSHRWNKEFRKIPVSKLDSLFRQVTEFNKADFNEEELKKSNIRT